MPETSAPIASTEPERASNVRTVILMSCKYEDGDVHFSIDPPLPEVKTDEAHQDDEVHVEIANGLGDWTSVVLKDLRRVEPEYRLPPGREEPGDGRPKHGSTAGDPTQQEGFFVWKVGDLPNPDGSSQKKFVAFTIEFDDSSRKFVIDPIYMESED